MPTYTLRTGQVNLRNSSATCAPYLVAADDINEGKGLTLAQAVRVGLVGRAGALQYTPSIEGKPKEVCGSFCTQTVDVQEGAILRFLVMLRPEWGQLNVTANVFILARETAALRRIRIRVGTHERLQYDHFEMVGRFELLDADQVAEEGGFVNERFKALGTRNKQDLVIESIEEIEPEIQRRKRLRKRRVRNDSGKRVVIKERLRRRGLKLD